MIDTSNFGPKDAKIIRENEGKTPYELADLGLTEKAFQRLISGDYKGTLSSEDQSQGTNNNDSKSVVDADRYAVKPSSVKEVASKSKTVVTSPNVYRKEKIASKSGSVIIINRRTGRQQQMSANAAARLLKQPNLYSILK